MKEAGFVFLYWEPENNVWSPTTCTYTHESTWLIQSGMKGVTNTFVAVRRADQFRQECGIENSDEERGGQQEAEEFWGWIYLHPSEKENWMRNKEMPKNYKPEQNIAKAGPIKHTTSTETND